MAKRKLRAGKRAKASVLTRMIKPKQHLPNDDKQHQSVVILDDKFENEKGKEVYSFRYEGDTSDGLLLHASVRYVQVQEEGNKERFFDDEGEGEGGKIKWADSEARRLLYQDVKDGKVDNMMSLKDVYSQRPEFAAYDFEKFSSRLATIRSSVTKLQERADDDLSAFDKYVSNHPISVYDRKGFHHWQGSKSQELAQQDIEAGLLQTGFRNLFHSREEYYMEYGFKEFSDRVRQEIKTKKYLHTLAVRGKSHKAS